MAEKIVVSVRVRPLNAKEEAKGTAWDVQDEKNTITPKVRRRAQRTHARSSSTFPLLFDIIFYNLRGGGGARGEGNKKKKVVNKKKPKRYLPRARKG